MTFTIGLYSVAGGLLILSFYKDRQKTRKVLLKAWKSFENIMPQFLGILLLVGLLLALVSPDIISSLIGHESGFRGVLVAALLGSVTLIPGFVAFPLAAALLMSGAGITQIAVFISTLMMVGIVTLPVEMKYFGKRGALLRNSLAFAAAITVALIMGGILS